MATEEFTGSDLSGSSGEANRVLTLTNTSTTLSAEFKVWVGNMFQHLDTNYTVSHKSASTEITLLDRTFDDSPITVMYFTSTPVASPIGILPLDARYIQKNINAVGNTCTLIEISRSLGSDEYRTKTETETEHENLPCFVYILSEADDSVRYGESLAGDVTFYFDASYEDYCVNGNRITWNSSTYQIKEVQQFRATGNVLYLIECRCAQI